MDLKKIIRSARGDQPVDLLLTDARVVEVFSGEIVQTDIAIADGYIAGLGSYDAENKLDMQGRFVAPGFVDAHVHIESAMTCVTEFARAVVARGTTCVVADPHEIANVLGLEGIHYMLHSSENQPMRICLALPSCVPATDLETAGARLTADDLKPFFGHERVVALAEMMNYPGVIFEDPEVLSKIELARKHRKALDGHAPGLSGHQLNAYIAAGIASDHECTSALEARQKLMAGMHIMVRESTGAHNLEALLPVVTPWTSRRMMWCTDDRHPHDLASRGHIDSIVRDAIEAGLNPVTAIQMATINPAEYFGISDIGAIAPGRRADLVVFSDLKAPVIEQVFSSGKCVAEAGCIGTDVHKPPPIAVAPSMHVKMNGLDFSIPAETRRARVIDIVPDQLITDHSVLPISLERNLAVADAARDLLKIAVIERHCASGNLGKGFVRGMGLKQGALASSVAHDSHNIIVVGTNDEDMRAAVTAVIRMGGGLAAAAGQTVHARLPLPIAGLMSDNPLMTVRDQLDGLLQVAATYGSVLQDPFMTLSFLALPVIPKLKLTDRGLVDVERFEFVSLFVD